MAPKMPRSSVLLESMSVAIVGVGGLGCPAALALCAAGIGRLRLIDADCVELSNLPRQLLYADTDVGRAKVEAAADRLRALAPAVAIITHRQRLQASNADELLSEDDFVIDATDGLQAKLDINDFAVRRQMAFCHAGVVAFQGQLMTVIPGVTACVRCLFPGIDADDETPSCSRQGIVGPVAGIVGALQAAQAIAYLTGDDTTGGRLIIYDGLTDRRSEVALDTVRRCHLCAALVPSPGG